MAAVPRCCLRAARRLCLTQRAALAHSKGMNNITFPTPIARADRASSSVRPAAADPPHSVLLLSTAPVRLLQCPAQGRTELRVRHGRIWLTCEGRPEDVFLDAGEGWTVSGAARLHLNAENGQEAMLEIRVRGG